jgi:hypothetical protein
MIFLLAVALLLTVLAHDHDHYNSHNKDIMTYTFFQQKNISNTFLNSLSSCKYNQLSSYDLQVLPLMIDQLPA